jgi:hypothetical protein
MASNSSVESGNSRYVNLQVSDVNTVTTLRIGAKIIIPNSSHPLERCRSFFFHLLYCINQPPHGIAEPTHNAKAMINRRQIKPMMRMDITTKISLAYNLQPYYWSSSTLIE